MKNIFKKHKIIWSQKVFIIDAVFGVLLLLLSLYVNYLANVYVTSRASNYVTDIILDNIPVFNVDFVFFEGFTMFIIFIVLVILMEPKKLPFVVKSIAFFIIIRSIFISLTHLGLPPNHSFLDTGNFTLKLTSGEDMFFSSHTGIPFLMALIYWDSKYLWYIFLAATAFFGTSVLLGHLHYSIDVFAALFITYGIYRMATYIFRKDYKMLSNEEILY